MAVIRVLLALISIPIALILVAPVVLLALPFWVVGLLSRAVARGLGPAHVAWRDVLEYQPVIGWKPRANLDTHYLDRGNDVCHIVTDFEGWPGKRSVSDSQVLVFGDSFAFGYGVDAKVSFTELVSVASVKGIGAPGYSMVQGLLLMRQKAQELRSKQVVWFICLDNDLHDNLHPNRPNLYTAPFVRNVNGDSDWEVVTHHVSTSKVHKASGRSPYYPFLAHLCTPGPVSKRAYSACAYLISEAKALCDQAGATLAVMTIPNKHQLSAPGIHFLASHMYNAPELDPGYPDFKIGDACRKQGIRFVALRDYLSPVHYKAADEHWNEKGHRKVAEILDEFYGEIMVDGTAAAAVARSDRMGSQPQIADAAVRQRWSMR